MNSLQIFLKDEPLDQITISRLLHKLWSDYGMQTEEIDRECLIKVLEDATAKSNDEERKHHLESLQDINKELKALMLDTDLFQSKSCKFDWKSRAVRNISSLKDVIKNQKDASQAHEQLHKKIGEVDVSNLLHDDPLVNGEHQSFLVGEKVSIKRLSRDASIRRVCSEFTANRDKIRQLYRFIVMPSEVVSHNQWVEQEHDREQVVRGIADILLQKIKMNILRKVTEGSEGTLVEAVFHLIEATLYRLPIEYDVEVTRSEKQSIASKNYKAQENIGSRGEKPDLMVRAFFRQKYNELVYIESGKWKSDDEKIHYDHNKLARLCLYGYKEISKKTIKDQLQKIYISFGINIAGDRLVLHGLLYEKGVKYYLLVASVKIPFRDESVEEVEEFVYTLMTLW
ncbi:8300_t:CDS:2, partial [Racocetra persica]